MNEETPLIYQESGFKESLDAYYDCLIKDIIDPLLTKGVVKENKTYILNKDIFSKRSIARHKEKLLNVTKKLVRSHRMAIKIAYEKHKLSGRDDDYATKYNFNKRYKTLYYKDPVFDLSNKTIEHVIKQNNSDKPDNSTQSKKFRKSVAMYKTYLRDSFKDLESVYKLHYSNDVRNKAINRFTASIIQTYDLANFLIKFWLLYAQIKQDPQDKDLFRYIPESSNRTFRDVKDTLNALPDHIKNMNPVRSRMKKILSQRRESG